jgi:hypothetical protein
MTESALMAMLLGPAAVTIHNDGNVARDTRLVELLYFVT